MRITITLFLITSVASAWAVQPSGNLSVTQIQYEKVMQRGDDESVIETGVYSIAVDGRYRNERKLASGATTVEILHPGRARIILRGRDKIAHVVPNTAVPVVPVSPDGGLRQIPGAVLEPLRQQLTERAGVELQSVGNLFIGKDQEPGGTRVVEGIVLEGVKQTYVLPNGSEFSSEFWFYFAQNPSGGILDPIVAESRVGGEGVFEVQRITDVSTEYVPDGHFLIPADYEMNIEDLQLQPPLELQR